MPEALRSNDVFINCPFDDGYRPLFNALVFVIYDLGFVARCAREADDSGEVRLAKIERIIEQCKYGIHDISEVSLDVVNHLPRFNMPLELGISETRLASSLTSNRIAIRSSSQTSLVTIFVRMRETQTKRLRWFVTGWRLHPNERIFPAGLRRSSDIGGFEMIFHGCAKKRACKLKR